MNFSFQGMMAFWKWKLLVTVNSPLWEDEGDTLGQAARLNRKRYLNAGSQDIKQRLNTDISCRSLCLVLALFCAGRFTWHWKLPKSWTTSGALIPHSASWVDMTPLCTSPWQHPPYLCRGVERKEFNLQTQNHRNSWVGRAPKDH